MRLPGRSVRDTPVSGVSRRARGLSDTPVSGVSGHDCGVRKIRMSLWYLLLETSTKPVSRSSASTFDTRFSPVSSSPASDRCLMPISSTSSPRVHARPNVHSDRYQSFNRCDPSFTRRARRMNVSGCSGGEASECGSRGCGFAYASAGAAAAPSPSTGSLEFGGAVGVDSSMRWAPQPAHAPAELRHPVLATPGVRLYGRTFRPKEYHGAVRSPSGSAAVPLHVVVHEAGPVIATRSPQRRRSTKNATAAGSCHGHHCAAAKKPVVTIRRERDRTAVAWVRRTAAATPRACR